VDTCRPPGYVDHFAFVDIADLNPVAHVELALQFDHDTGEDVGDVGLHGQADDHGEETS